MLGDGAFVLDAQRLAKELLGDAIASNMFMLGAAWQKGLVPLRRAAIERAIELNGVAIEANKQAFEWGRRAAHDLAGVEKLAARNEPEPAPAPTLDALIERRIAQLKESRGERDAARYRALIERVRAAEQAAGLGEALTAAVARSYHKLLAVKDEWEVPPTWTPSTSPSFSLASVAPKSADTVQTQCWMHRSAPSETFETRILDIRDWRNRRVSGGRTMVRLTQV